MALDALFAPKSKSKKITIEVTGEMAYALKAICKQCKRPEKFVVLQLLDAGIVAFNTQAHEITKAPETTPRQDE